MLAERTQTSSDKFPGTTQECVSTVIDVTRRFSLPTFVSVSCGSSRHAGLHNWSVVVAVVAVILPRVLVRVHRPVGRVHHSPRLAGVRVVERLDLATTPAAAVAPARFRLHRNDLLDVVVVHSRLLLGLLGRRPAAGARRRRRGGRLLLGARPLGDGTVGGPLGRLARLWLAAWLRLGLRLWLLVFVLRQS